MGRSPFFGGSRKMRGFPLNLNPGALGGEDGPPPGFPYFGAEKFEFGYGGPVAFHHEFFGAHPPPHPHGPPFSGPGNPGESLEFSSLFRALNSSHPRFSIPFDRILRNRGKTRETETRACYYFVARWESRLCGDATCIRY